MAVARQWMRDEKFWREVTARAASGAIVLLVGFLAAVWLGYIKTPEGFNATQAIVQGIFVIVASLILFRNYRLVHVAKEMSRVTSRWRAWGITIITLLAMIFMIGILGGGIINLVFQWARPFFQGS
jgi:hypothetical protein